MIHVEKYIPEHRVLGRERLQRWEMLFAFPLAVDQSKQGNV